MLQTPELWGPGGGAEQSSIVSAQTQSINSAEQTTQVKPENIFRGSDYIVVNRGGPGRRGIFYLICNDRQIWKLERLPTILGIPRFAKIISCLGSAETGDDGACESLRLNVEEEQGRVEYVHGKVEQENWGA
ncbi:hypothetical protein RUND412_007867 [Rhizina undulata]